MPVTELCCSVCASGAVDSLYAISVPDSPASFRDRYIYIIQDSAEFVKGGAAFFVESRVFLAPVQLLLRRLCAMIFLLRQPQQKNADLCDCAVKSEHGEHRK